MNSAQGDIHVLSLSGRQQAALRAILWAVLKREIKLKLTHVSDNIEDAGLEMIFNKTAYQIQDMLEDMQTLEAGLTQTNFANQAKPIFFMYTKTGIDRIAECLKKYENGESEPILGEDKWVVNREFESIKDSMPMATTFGYSESEIATMMKGLK